MAVKLGAHMSISGGCDKAVWAASKIGFQTVQLFSKNNNQWKVPPLTDEHIALFRAAIVATGIVDPVIHNSYLINLGTANDFLWKGSIDAMTVEVGSAGCEAFGVLDLVAHPGAHTGSGEDAGLRRIAQGLDEVHRRTKGFAARIDLETTAGQGTCLGHRFEHLERILEPGPGAWSVSAFAPTPVIFSRRGIPWRHRESTMRRSRSWIERSAASGFGSGT